MNRSEIAYITPSVLIWARDICNLSIDDAAKKIGVKPQKLEAWENGASFPTINQAYTIGHIYRVPFPSLWLNEPPNHKLPRIRDFRRLPETGYENYSYNLSIQLRDLLEKRELAISFADNVHKAIRPFQKKINESENIEEIASQIRRYLNLSWDEQRICNDVRISYSMLKEKVEALDILVFQIEKVTIEECRGFTIFHSIFPIIALNRKDSYSGRTFSLMHELVHLLFHETSISNISDYDFISNTSTNREYVVNQIAASVLMPKNIIAEFVSSTTEIHELRPIIDLSKIFSVSKESMIIRLNNLGLIQDSVAESLIKSIKYPSKKKTKGFLPPANDFISKYGKPVSRLMLDNYSRGYINEGDFTAYTGLHERNIVKIRALLTGIIE